MESRFALLGGLLLLLGLSLRSPPATAQMLSPAAIRTDRGEPSIVLWPTPEAPAEIRRRLAAWERGYESRMAPVEESWEGVLNSIHTHRAWYLEARCARLAAEMERLDVGRLTPAPHPVIDLHLRALLDHLFAAARICSREKLFATEYRLVETSGAQQRLQTLLRRYLASSAPGSADAGDDLRPSD